MLVMALSPGDAIMSGHGEDRHGMRHGMNWRWGGGWLALLCGLPLAAVASGTRAPLTIVAMDQASPPYVIGEGDHFAPQPGLAVELAQRAAKACGVELQLLRQPGLRMLQSLKSGSADAALLLSYNEERAQFAVYPLRDGQPDGRQRMSTLRYVLFVRHDSTLTWDGERLSPPQAVVGSNIGWSVIKDLERHQIKVETALNVGSNFNKLQAGRIDAYAIQDLLAAGYLATHPKLAVRALPQPLVSKDYFMPFSRQFAARQPQLVQCMWQQVARQRDALLQRRMAIYLNH